MKFGQVLRRAARLYTFFSLGYLAARHGIGDDHWLVALLANFNWLLLLPSLPLTASYLLQRRWRLAVFSALPAAAWLRQYVRAFLHHAMVLPAPGWHAIKVMTFNLQGNSGPAEAVAAIRRESPDILTLFELREATARYLEQELSDTYPYRVMRPSKESKRGPGLFSRYPLRDSLVAPIPPGRDSAIDTYVDIHGISVHLIGVHLVVTGLQREFMTHMRAYTERTYAGRETQVLEILSRIAGASEPVIVTGDHNQTDQSRAYAYLATYLRDSFAEVGHGLGLTWPLFPRFGWRWPLLRIDYIWHSGQIQALEAHLGPPTRSDHRPLVALLAVPPAEPPKIALRSRHAAAS